MDLRGVCACSSAVPLKDEIFEIHNATASIVVGVEQ
jgi:hypothetical protein